jgi:hypothetical protein
MKRLWVSVNIMIILKTRIWFPLVLMMIYIVKQKRIQMFPTSTLITPRFRKRNILISIQSNHTSPPPLPWNYFISSLFFPSIPLLLSLSNRFMSCIPKNKPKIFCEYLSLFCDHLLLYFPAQWRFFKEKCVMNINIFLFSKGPSYQTLSSTYYLSPSYYFT